MIYDTADDVKAEILPLRVSVPASNGIPFLEISTHDPVTYQTVRSFRLSEEEAVNLCMNLTPATVVKAIEARDKRNAK